MKGRIKMETKVTDLQRIANLLKIKGDDQYLVLKIQDVIKAKENKYKKQDFSYAMLKAQNDRLYLDIENLHNKFAESIGIHEHIMVKQSRDIIKKENGKLLEENHKLRSIVEGYRKRDCNDRIKSIVK
jgi:hypothetical protein